MSELLTVRQLKRRFGRHAVAVLTARGYISYVDDPASKSLQYRVDVELPTATEFRAMELAHYSRSITDLTQEAFDIFQELSEELRDWYDNLPESFQNGSKGDMLQEASDALEGLGAPDCDDLDSLTASYIPGEAESRAARRDEAIVMLQCVIDRIDDEIERVSKIEDACGHDGVVYEGPSIDDLESLKGELETAISEAESVEFPGMYS